MSLSVPLLSQSMTLIASALSPSELLNGLHDAARAMGAEATALGIVRDDEIHHFARGFDAAVVQRFALIPLTVALPGPFTVRAGVPQFLVDRASTFDRFPDAVAVIEASDYGAAACLPLVRGGSVFGYVAMHYVGSREFDAADQFLLTTVAAAVAGTASRILAGDPTAESALGPTDHELMRLRTEVAGLTDALASRAVIEQAKGILMNRYQISPGAAWRLLVRVSNATNVKVRVLAEQCVMQGVDVVPALTLDESQQP